MNLLLTFCFNLLQVWLELFFIELSNDEQIFFRRSKDFSKRRFVETTVGTIEDDAAVDLNDLFVQDFRLHDVQVEQLRSSLVS